MANKFADPDIEDGVLRIVQDTIEDKQPVYPWVVLEDVETNTEYSKKESRKALRKLRMSNHAVPAEEFKGRIRLAERYEG